MKLLPKNVGLKEYPAISREEVSKHCTEDDAYVIIDDYVYDVSHFGEKHPGGDVIYELAGKDASLPFRAYHPNYVYEKWLSCRIVGKLENTQVETERESYLESELTLSHRRTESQTKSSLPDTNAKRIQDLDAIYLDLYAKLEREGVFATKWYWYVFKAIFSMAIFFSGIVLATGKSSWFLPEDFHLFGLQVSAETMNSVWVRAVLAGWLIGLGQHQVAFICHDMAHCSVFSTWAKNYFFCLPLANSVFGVSALWWKYTHNQHHVVTNEWDRDPDITHVPIFAVTKSQYLHPKGLKMNIFQKLLLYISPITFLPIVMFIGRFSMYWQGVYMLFFLRQVPTMPWQKLHLAQKWLNAERALTTFYFFWWYLLLNQLPSTSHLLWLVVASHLTTGALHIQLTLSHYDRPNVFSQDKPRTSWFEQQVLTGRNIEGNILNEWIYGGLHYQIEHHLFPRAPRHSHRTIKKHVQKICNEYGIEYSTGGFWPAFASVLQTIVSESRYVFHKPFSAGVFSAWSKMELTS